MISRWPHSRTPTTTPRVHSLPAPSSPRIHQPPPVKLRARSVHAKVAPLRAVDVLPTLAGWTAHERHLGKYTHTSGAIVQAVNSRFDFFRATAQLLSGRLTYRDGECATLAEACALALAPAAAEPVAAPQPTAAPATPHVWTAGQWAAWKGCSPRMTTGKAYEVLSVSSWGSLDVICDDGRRDGWMANECFAPATAPAPAGEREWTPPAPWVVDSDGDYGFGAPYMRPEAKRRVQVRARVATCDWHDDTGERRKSGVAPTLAQACCAALSISLEDNGHICWALDAKGESLANGGAGHKTADERREYIARAALEAHARREPAPAVESERG